MACLLDQWHHCSTARVTDPAISLEALPVSGVVRLLASQQAMLVADLARSHEQVHERLGLLACEIAETSEGLLWLPVEYQGFDDTHYEQSADDRTAILSPQGIRCALSFVHQRSQACCYIHLHRHRGAPGLSQPDYRHADYMLDDLLKVSTQPVGYFVLSQDHITGVYRSQRGKPMQMISRTTVIGTKLRRASYAG